MGEKSIPKVVDLGGDLEESSPDSLPSSEDLRYVLWIRHCEACHNVAKGIYRQQPLCTEKGIAEAFTFGKNFDKIDKAINKLFHNGKKKKIRYHLYCSVLARAMETSKIMSISMDTFLENSDKITRINGIQEVDKDFFSGPNIITKQVSDNSCLFLNKNIQEGLEIDCNRIINNNTNKPSDIFKIAKSKDVEEYYKQFKNKLFSSEFTEENSEFTEENVQCIVSHSAFIKDIMKLPHRLNNLDAVLCVYKKQDGSIIEKKKYLILLEDLIKNNSDENNSDEIYYDLVNNADKIPTIKKNGWLSSKIRYGTGKIDRENLQDGYDYANKLFKTCEQFKNCGYKTNELYGNSCEHDKEIQEENFEREQNLLNQGIDSFPSSGGKRGKKTRHKKIKKLTKKFQKKKYKKTKKGRKKKFTKKKKSK